MEKNINGNNSKLLYYNYLKTQNKPHRKNTVKWLQMFNFDSFPTWEKIVTGIAIVYGWVYHLFLLDISFFSWEFFIKGAEGFIFAISTAAVVRITNIYIDVKIKPRIGKKKRKKIEDDE